MGGRIPTEYPKMGGRIPKMSPQNTEKFPRILILPQSVPIKRAEYPDYWTEYLISTAFTIFLAGRILNKLFFWAEYSYRMWQNTHLWATEYPDFASRIP